MRIGTPGSDTNTQVHQIFALVLARRTNKQIAHQLGIEFAEVANIIDTAKRQLGVRNRYEAALIMANRHGFSADGIAASCTNAEESSHFEPRRDAQATKLVDTKNEQNSISAYLRDVGSNVSQTNIVDDIIGERRSLNKLQDRLISMPVFRSLLMMLLIVFAGAMALGSLVSAMQGFDVWLDS